MIFIWIVVGLFALVVVLFLLMWMRAIRASGRRNEQLEKDLLPVIAALQENDSSAPQLVYDAAQNPTTRNFLYEKLQELGRVDIFPEEFRTNEKHAESDLVTWLMHPNELNAIPAEIHLAKRIAIEEGGRKGTVFLFRFLTDSSHDAWERGWMAGVSGVYWENSNLDDEVRGAFSEFIPFNQMTEEQHVEFLAASRNKKGLVVPS